MKKLCCLFTALCAVCFMANAAVANELKTEAYAHPTMFGSAAQESVSADSVYITGGKIYKSGQVISVKSKDNVVVASWAKDVLATIKENTDSKVFNPKMPVLRSELAVILAEGLCLKDRTPSSKYTDISSGYWAKSWIDRALAANIMIGYPDNTFKPDQPITKAEVFATIATLIEVPTDRSLLIPDFKGRQVQFIPKWAIAPSKEVFASQLLESVPQPAMVADNEYLSKEQVAYLVSALRQNFIYNYKNGVASGKLVKYTPTCLTIKLSERLSARTSNIGDKFSAVTTKPVTISEQCFEAGAVVKGEIIEVSRPGLKNPGYIKVKFTEIKSGEKCLKFPKNISEAQAAKIKNPNFVARLFGMPFSAAGRVLGITGRTAGGMVNVAGNGVEQFGDNLSNAYVNTLALQPKAGLKSAGSSFVTVGKGVFDMGKLLASGVFGVVYEVTDEIKYLIVPCASNNSSLNPGEELIIVF